MNVGIDINVCIKTKCKDLLIYNDESDSIVIEKAECTLETCECEKWYMSPNCCVVPKKCLYKNLHIINGYPIKGKNNCKRGRLNK